MMLPLLNFALQAAEESGGGPFDVNPGLILWTWAVFIALFLVLRKFAWPAIVDATVAREKRIADQLAEAERLNGEAQQALGEHKRLLAGAKEEAQSIINESKSVAQKERDQLLAKTRGEQDEILERARREIGAERDRALAELRREAVDLSLAAAAKLIETTMDDDTNRKIVAEYLSTLEG
ncbi:MAG: F0F1 ATP synthase subunit B [Gemmatimonadales bacterium]